MTRRHLRLLWVCSYSCLLSFPDFAFSWAISRSLLFTIQPLVKLLQFSNRAILIALTWFRTCVSRLQTKHSFCSTCQFQFASAWSNFICWLFHWSVLAPSHFSSSSTHPWFAASFGVLWFPAWTYPFIKVPSLHFSFVPFPISLARFAASFFPKGVFPFVRICVGLETHPIKNYLRWVGLLLHHQSPLNYPD